MTLYTSIEYLSGLTVFELLEITKEVGENGKKYRV